LPPVGLACLIEVFARRNPGGIDAAIEASAIEAGRLGAVLGPFEQGVALEFLLDERGQIEIGKLQKFDGL
jgi:hypothetical protein